MIKSGRKILHVEEKLPDLIEAFSKKKDLLVIYLFGSRALNASDDLSDIDIGLLFMNGQIQIKDELDLIGEATSLLCTDEVSLVILNNVPLVIQYGVIHDAKVLYCSDDKARHDFEQIVTEKYFDFSYYLNSYDQEFINMMQGKPFD